ncbi:hypothetical protein FOZ60_003812 [Perkinsus olseni]|uniref:N-acetyltransferase domain-containing protein n=1 Tax=Perkinsus olseni TaxID=32597 RepID=A0A7J6NUF1_PEROL|nr:hypothetical protein FOZ60_003812 [Perkinsus olseni]
MPCMSSFKLLCAGLLLWAVHALRSPPRKSSPVELDPSQLQYRCSLPTDSLGERKVEGSASFVAVHRTADGKESVLGVIEYALLSAATRGRWVYVEGVKVKDAEWQSKGLETEILTRLLAYMKQAKPQVLGAFVLVQPHSREEGVFKSVGFRRTGESSPFEAYAFLFTSTAAASLPADLPPIDMRLPVTNDGDVIEVYEDIFG